MSYKKTIAFLADRNGQAVQSIPSGVATIIAFNQKQIDIGSFYNDVNFTWTPQPGLYLIQAHVRILLLDSNDELNLVITKNGVPIYFNNEIATMNNQNPATGALGVTVSNGTDTYQATVEHSQGGNLDISSDPVETYFDAVRIK